MKHKHYELLVAWLADHTTRIEYKDQDGEWNHPIGIETALNPITHPELDWRIKPAMQKPFERLTDELIDAIFVRVAEEYGVIHEGDEARNFAREVEKTVRGENS